jgi:pyruvate/2-oxoacid:ferredoxin oxidoreductase alpha subunit
MMTRPIKTIDGTEAVASVAHRINEVIAIYPITPSSGMGELADAVGPGHAGEKDPVPVAGGGYGRHGRTIQAP